MKKSTAEHYEPLSPDAEFEAQLDLLVDDELPEDRRTSLLRRIDQSLANWRPLGLRFLERQVERRAARMMLAQAAVGSGHVGKAPSSQRSSMSWLRMAAAMVLTAGLFGIIGAVWGLHRQVPTQTAIRAGAPGGGQTALGPKAQPASTPIEFLPGPLPPELLGGSDNAGLQHLLIVPDGANRTVAYPVIRDTAAKVTPVY
ncbi:MAG: hypothetical protein HKL96_06920 [Phycisphaerales bacterium]|nr:hypothetical protein [Phycisphaerales bacterium]